MFNIGFLGIGQGGSNICEVADAFNYTTAIINTSLEDLNAVTHIQRNNKYLLGDKGGCGKNRTVAVNEVKNHYKAILSFANEVFKDNATEEIKIVYVIFTGGGGTGSGTGPIIVDLLNKSIKGILFCPIIICPSLSESIGASINTIQAISEVSKLNVPFTVFDNNVAFTKYANMSRREIYDEINMQIILEFNSIFKTDRKASKAGNMDDRDIYELLTVPGYFFIHKTDFSKDSKKSEALFANMTKTILKSWEDDNLYVALPYDYAIQYAGFIYNMPNLKLADTKYDEIKKVVGVPIDIFEGVYDSSDMNDSYVVSILSGLSAPTDKIKQISEVVKTNNDNRISERDNSFGDLDWLKDIKTSSAKKDIIESETPFEKLLTADSKKSVTIVGEEMNDTDDDDDLLDDFFSKYQ